LTNHRRLKKIALLLCNAGLSRWFLKTRPTGASCKRLQGHRLCALHVRHVAGQEHKSWRTSRQVRKGKPHAVAAVNKQGLCHAPAMARCRGLCEWSACAIGDSMHMLRNLLAVFALVALLGAGLHESALAHAPATSHGQAKTQIAAQADAAPCHESTAGESASPKPASHNSEKADCCPNGCDGHCTMVGAFFAAPDSHASAFYRAVLRASPKARPVSAMAAASERPPKS